MNLKNVIYLLLFSLILVGCSDGDDGDDGKVYTVIDSSSDVIAIDLTDVGITESPIFFDTKYETTKSGTAVWADSAGTIFTIAHVHEVNKGESGKTGTIPLVKGEDGKDGTFTLFLNGLNTTVSESRQLVTGGRTSTFEVLNIQKIQEDQVSGGMVEIE